MEDVSVDNELLDNFSDELLDELDEELLNDSKFIKKVIGHIICNAHNLVPEESLPSNNQQRKRKRFNHQINFNETNWGKMLNNPETQDPNSTEGKKFRRRFRIPYPLFKECLVPLCKEHNIFNLKKERKGIIPIELKIMAALRVLGRGSCCDDIAEMSEIGESTANHIFKMFVQGMAKSIFPLFVKPPTGPYLEKMLQLYNLLGLPGCIGSMDCTHIRYAQCPAYQMLTL
jgi:hypothetical protein